MATATLGNVQDFSPATAGQFEQKLLEWKAAQAEAGNDPTTHEI